MPPISWTNQDEAWAVLKAQVSGKEEQIELRSFNVKVDFDPVYKFLREHRYRLVFRHDDYVRCEKQKDSPVA